MQMYFSAFDPRMFSLAFGGAYVTPSEPVTSFRTQLQRAQARPYLHKYHYVEKYTPKMLFWYIEGAKYFSFDNMTLDPKAFVRSFTRTIAISHFYIWENIC